MKIKYSALLEMERVKAKPFNTIDFIDAAKIVSQIRQRFDMSQDASNLLNRIESRILSNI